MLRKRKEQGLIIQSLESHNVVVNAIPGSGKTTTSLFIAAAFKHSKILLLTYSAHLKMETRNKIYKATNVSAQDMHAHSFHSFYYAMYNHDCVNDEVLMQLISEDAPRVVHYRYDVIIVDECQDMTELLYKSVCKIYKDNDNRNAKICILGDENQSIYEFKGADKRYLKHATDAVFNYCDAFQWKTHTLSHSFRLSKETAAFVNNCVLGFNKIRTTEQSSVKPNYLVCDIFSEMQLIYDKIANILRDKENKPDDILVLAPTIRSRNLPIRKLANKLSENGYNLYMETGANDECIGWDQLHSKIALLTYHAAKGLERKFVFVYNFDSGYYAYPHTKNDIQNCCPDPLYVAITRAKQQLILIHHKSHNYLPFLNTNELADHCNIEGIAKITNKTKRPEPIMLCVTDMIQHLDHKILEGVKARIKYRVTHKVDEIIHVNREINNEVGGVNLCEAVAQITGQAINLYTEYLATGALATLSHESMRNRLQATVTARELNYVAANFVQKIEGLNPSISSELLQIANIYLSTIDGTRHKLTQIVSYDWLLGEHLQKCAKRIVAKEMWRNCSFEKTLKTTNEQTNVNLVGIVDGITDANLYELKFVDCLLTEHLLQLAMYMYINEASMSCPNDDKMRYVLFNIKTGEKREIYNTYEELSEIFHYVYYSKYTQIKRVSDDTFFDNAQMIKRSFPPPVNVTNTAYNCTRDIEQKAYIVTRISKMKQSDVKQELRANKLKVGGLVGDCRNRLINHLSQDFPPLVKIDPIDEVVQHGKVIVFDTETTGLPFRHMFGGNTYPSPNQVYHYDISRLLQIGYIIYDIDDVELKRVEILIRPDDFVVEATEIHGITAELANERGLPIQQAMDNIRSDFEQCDLLIAHNIKFDINIMLSECYRYGFESMAKIFASKKLFCTKEHSKARALTLPFNYYSLENVYAALTQNEREVEHTALADAEMCAECYRALKSSAT